MPLCDVAIGTDLGKMQDSLGRGTRDGGSRRNTGHSSQTGSEHRTEMPFSGDSMWGSRRIRL